MPNLRNCRNLRFVRYRIQVVRTVRYIIIDTRASREKSLSKQITQGHYIGFGKKTKNPSTGIIQCSVQKIQFVSVVCLSAGYKFILIRVLIWEIPRIYLGDSEGISGWNIWYNVRSLNAQNEYNIHCMVRVFVIRAVWLDPHAPPPPPCTSLPNLVKLSASACIRCWEAIQGSTSMQLMLARSVRVNGANKKSIDVDCCNASLHTDTGLYPGFLNNAPFSPTLHMCTFYSIACTSQAPVLQPPHGNIFKQLETTVQDIIRRMTRRMWKCENNVTYA